MTGSEIVEKAKKLIGTPYVYGAKYSDGTLTLSRLNVLKKENPKTITDSYYNKAKKYIGQICTDCSGLVCYCYGIGDIGSYNLYDKYEKISLSDLKPGMMVWKPGHIGIYIGNGEVIEAKGINYGTIKSKLSDTAQKTGLYSKNVNYDDSTDYGHSGWCRDSVGRQYANSTKRGDYLKGGIYLINGLFYAFNNEGYLIENIDKIKISENGNLEVK